MTSERKDSKGLPPRVTRKVCGYQVCVSCSFFPLWLWQHHGAKAVARTASDRLWEALKTQCPLGYRSRASGLTILWPPVAASWGFSYGPGWYSLGETQLSF